MALEWDTVQRILILVMILSFGVAILGAIGEYRGWWNDVGEVLMTFGTVTGALVGIVSLVTSAGQGTVENVQDTVEGVQDTVEGVQGSVEGVQRTVEDNNSLLEDNNELLEESTRKLETLDDIQLELDRQTGVLERQVEVLHQIRDG